MQRKILIIIGDSTGLGKMKKIARTLGCSTRSYPTIKLAQKAISPASIVFFRTESSHDFIELAQATRHKAPVVVITKQAALLEEVQLYGFRRLLLEKNMLKKLPQLIRQLQLNQAVLVVNQKDPLLPKIMDELAHMCMAVTRITFMSHAVKIAQPEDTLIVTVVKRTSQLNTLKRLNACKCKIVIVGPIGMKAIAKKLGMAFIDKAFYSQKN